MICAIELMIVIIATTTSCVDLKINTFACREREGEEKQRDSERVVHHFLSHPLLHILRLVAAVVGRIIPHQSIIYHNSYCIEPAASQFQSQRERFLFTNCSEREERERESRDFHIKF